MPRTSQKTFAGIAGSASGGRFFPGPDGNKILVRELAELWLLDIKDMMRPSSYALYQNYVGKAVRPVKVGGNYQKAAGRKLCG